MSIESIMNDISNLADDAKEFIGEFVYAPFGVESSELLNSVTLYALLGLIALFCWRVTSPAPHPRVRDRRKEYDFGRNV